MDTTSHRSSPCCSSLERAHEHPWRTLEILELTQTRVPRTMLLPLLLDSCLISDCIGIVLEYVQDEDEDFFTAEHAAGGWRRMDARVHLLTLFKLECMLARLRQAQ